MHGIRDRILSAPVPTEKSQKELKILYEHDGILVVQLADDRSIELQMSEDVRIVAAFRNSGLEPGFATQLMLGHLSGTDAREEDQFADPEQTIQTEHVVTRIANTPTGEVSVYDVGYYPAAAQHANDETVGVHTRDCEIILGTRGFGRLEIAPIRSKNGELVAHRDEMVEISIKENTLAILPKDKQGNRWKSFDRGDSGIPGLEVRYVATPGPYDSSTVKQAKII